MVAIKMFKNIHWKQLRKNPIASAISILSLTTAALPVYAAPCAGGAGIDLVVNGSANSCSADEVSYQSITVQNGATVTQNNPVKLTPNPALRFTGIKVEAGAQYKFGAPGGNNDLEIHGQQNGSTYGESYAFVVADAKAEVVAGRVAVNAGSSNAKASVFGLLSRSQGTLNIQANEVNVSLTASGGAGGVNAWDGGKVNISGAGSNLSMTKIDVTGKSTPVGIGARSGGQVTLDLVDITSVGKGSLFSPSSYNIGVHTAGRGTLVDFKGGDIVTRANDTFSYAGTGIRAQELSRVNVRGYNTSAGAGHLKIETSTMDSRGIRATGNAAVAINSDKYADFVTTIQTHGSIADGINAGRLGSTTGSGQIVGHAGEIGAQYSGSSVTIYGETHITTDGNNSYSLRLIGDGASINLLALEGQGRSTVHSASTAVRFSFGNGYSVNEDGGTDVRSQSMTLEQVDLTTDGLSGSWARANSGTGMLSDTNGNNTWTTGHLIQVGDHSGDVGIQSERFGAMTVADSVRNAQLTLRNSTATAADGKDLLNVTYGGGTDLVTDKVSSSFTLNAENGTILDGRIFTDETLDVHNQPSTTTLNLNSQSKWYTTKDSANVLRESNLTHLNVNSGHVYLNDRASWEDSSGKPVTGQPASYVSVRVQTLGGDGGTFYFHSDVANGLTDKLVVTGNAAASGKHYVSVRNDGAQATNGNETLPIIETHGGNAQFVSAQVLGNGTVSQQNAELGGYEYAVRQKAGTNDWELYAVPKITQSARAVVNFVNVNYLMSYIDMQTLLQRMGQLRQGVNTDKDVWIRTFGGKLDGFSGGGKLDGFDMGYYGMQAGVDKQLEVNGGTVYVGVMGGYTRGNPDYAYGDGKAQAYHVGVYGTYVNEDDYYVDAALRYTHMQNRFDVLDTQQNKVHGSGSTNGVGFSVEGGKRFYLQDAQSKQGLYVEPQLQYIYNRQGSDTVHNSNGLVVGLDSVNSNMLRVSALVGYAVKEGSNPLDAYAKIGYAHEFDGKSSYTLNGSREQHNFGQSMLDLGVGINAQVNNQHNFFLELGYTHGERFDSKQINAGYRFVF